MATSTTRGNKVLTLQLKFLSTETTCNKKVLLRERKRHTARRVASTPYVVLSGHPPSQGTPPGRVPPRQGTPPARVPPRPEYPPWAGYPPGWTWQGTPLGRVPPRPGYPLARVPPRPGYPPARIPPLGRVPPGWTWQGTPPLPHGILGNVAKHYGIQVPPPKCGQTENITFPILRMRAVIIIT